MLFVDGKLAEEQPRIVYGLPYLKERQWTRTDGGIHFAPGEGKTPYAYELSYAKHPVGITLYDVESVVISDLNIRGYQLDGINAHDNAFDCVVTDVNCTANGRSGISIGGSSRVKIVDSKLFDNGDIQLNTSGWSTTEVIRTRLAAIHKPIWRRDADLFDNGPRLTVDEEPQAGGQGWLTKDEEEAWAKERAAAKEEEADELADESADDEQAAESPQQPADDTATDESADASGDDSNEDVLNAADNEEDPFAEGNDDEDMSDDFGGAEEDAADGGDEEDPFGDFGADDEDPFADIE